MDKHQFMNVNVNRRWRGVTLIELMIVVVIIGILAAISYPSYTRWVTETRRSDANIALSQLANDLEKFYSECGAYTNRITNTPRNCTLPAAAGALTAGTLGRPNDLSPSDHYQLSITIPAAGQYTITATPRGQQLTNDTECATLTLTNTGQTGATGTNTARCWRK
jgi:type IV pilus assembly protein PilE